MAFTKIAAAGIGSTGTVTLENLTITGVLNVPTITGAGSTADINADSLVVSGVSTLGVTTVTTLTVTGNARFAGVSTFSTELQVGTGVTISDGSISATGVSTFSNGIIVAAGSTESPAISPSGDSNTGIFFPAPDTVAVSYGGTEVLRVSNGNIGIGTIGTDNVNNIINIQNSSSLNEIQFRGSSYTNVYSNTDNGFDIGINNPSSTASFNILTANSSKFTVDSSGRVTTPYQPFVAGGSASVAVSGSEQHVWATSGFVFSNIGNHWNASTGVFTAPVDGVYYVSAGIRYSSVSVTPLYIFIYFLASYQSASGQPILLWSPGTESGGTYRPRILTALMYCRANDTIRPRLYVPSGTITIDGGSTGQTDCFLNIYLLG